MDKQKFLSIGQMAKHTGVNFNSLRYYEQLGILHPAYIDPQSGYRYYSFSQIHLVEAIQFCIDLGIPLKEFHAYLENDGQNINYTKLIAHGTMRANEKIKAIEHRLNMLEQIQNDINRAEYCSKSSTPTKHFYPEKVLWITPYQGSQDSDEYYGLFKKTMYEINKRRLKIGYEYGLILFYTSGKNNKQYFFIDMELPPERIDAFDNVTYLPASEYLCISQKTSSMDKAEEYFAEYFKMEYDKVIIQTKLFTGEFNYQSHMYEIRCLLPSN